MTGVAALAALAVLVIVIAVAGIRLGMLLAPAVFRLTEPEIEEDARDRTD